MSLFKQSINKYNFEYIFNKYSECLFYYSFAIVNDEDVAKDLVHDSFIYIWNNRDKLDSSYSLKSYLYRIVKNNSLNYKKHEEVKNKYINYSLANNEEIEETYDNYETQYNKVREALEQLPPRCKEIIEKCFLEGKKYKEIAEELDISVNTVKSHITSGLQAIRKKVKLETILFLALLKKNKK